VGRVPEESHRRDRARGRRAGTARYYERWLASFERLLAEKGMLEAEELDDRTEAFEFGERDEVY